MSTRSEWPDTSCRWCGKHIICPVGFEHYRPSDRECPTCRGLNRIICKQVRRVLRQELKRLVPTALPSAGSRPPAKGQTKRLG